MIHTPEAKKVYVIGGYAPGNEYFFPPVDGKPGEYIEAASLDEAVAELKKRRSVGALPPDNEPKP